MKNKIFEKKDEPIKLPDWVILAALAFYGMGKASMLPPSMMELSAKIWDYLWYGVFALTIVREIWILVGVLRDKTVDYDLDRYWIYFSIFRCVLISGICVLLALLWNQLCHCLFFVFAVGKSGIGGSLSALWCQKGINFVMFKRHQVKHCWTGRRKKGKRPHPTSPRGGERNLNAAVQWRDKWLMMSG